MHYINLHFINFTYLAYTSSRSRGTAAGMTTTSKQVSKQFCACTKQTQMPQKIIILDYDQWNVQDEPRKQPNSKITIFRKRANILMLYFAYLFRNKTGLKCWFVPSKRRANIEQTSSWLKQAYWNLAPCLKCRPRLRLLAHNWSRVI